ncbi:MAG: hypothetical protein QG575_226, partial [Euryarchaeota archaeon]|nr:hypothetical protein [Euryarchaeota archaeon]
AFLGAANAADQDLLKVSDNYTSELNDSALGLALVGQPSGDLTASEKEGLLYMVEEEKLAEDVYQVLNEKWNLRVFDNIGKAERTHEAAVKTLLTRYSLPDPTKGAGVFSDETLQALYDDLVSRGSASTKDALQVGAAIEEIDILDLEERMDQTDKADVLLVYANLKKGSENHLRAFVNNLQRQGFEYSPEYLSSEEYDSIIRGK